MVLLGLDFMGLFGMGGVLMFDCLWFILCLILLLNL